MYRRRNVIFWILMLIIIAIYAIEWFVDSVHMRILAGALNLIAISILPIKKRKKKAKASEQLNEDVKIKSTP